ncbi:MAG: glycosyltransferase, partial [Coriobacteriales bacterium]|nr:glycosyltransferase [Coriobacteriales bacterium]
GAGANVDRIEIIIVDDGSVRDDTAARADSWAERLPDVVKALHQENAGHGGAVNTGLAAASGTWFKVVDADDWLDCGSLDVLLKDLIRFEQNNTAVDMVIANYVYEKVEEGKRTPIRYTGILPEGRVFGWGDIGRFKPSQNLLMHAVVYRTGLLRDIGLKLPEKTFYVDNIFVYVPLPAVERIYYLNVDLYRYYIGRADQSVNQQIMVNRIEQQLRITRIMIDAFHLQTDVAEPRLRSYMMQYLAMMLTICSVFLRLSNRFDAEERRREIWAYLKENDPQTYPRLRRSAIGLLANLPGKPGEAITIAGYTVARKLFRFN